MSVVSALIALGRQRASRCGGVMSFARQKGDMYTSAHFEPGRAPRLAMMQVRLPS